MPVDQSIMSSKMVGITVFLATLTVSCLVSLVAADGDQPVAVHFSLMVSSAPTLDTSGVVSVADQALKLINNDTILLPGYNLRYSQVLDAQVRQIVIIASLYWL